MGREIIRLESPNNPAEHSRLWCPNDIHDVRIRPKGTKKIEVIVFNSPMKNMKYNTKAFKNMESLRFLQIDETHLYGKFKYLSKELRCLQWNDCPLKYINIPSRCSFEKLVRLEMWNSNIKEFQIPLKMVSFLRGQNSLGYVEGTLPRPVHLLATASGQQTWSKSTHNRVRSKNRGESFSNSCLAKERRRKG